MTLWIEIVNWDTFQHYKDRQPVWIKLHLKLLDNDDYLQLPPGTRALLIELWMLYAKSGSLRLDTRSLSRRLQHRVTSQQLERLASAGFIRLAASKISASRDRDRKDLERDLKMDYGKVLKDLR